MPDPTPSPPTTTPTNKHPAPRASRSPLAALRWAVLAIAVWAVCWVGLGLAPLNRTEGHRAIPAWELLERGELFPTRLFGQVYLNKPPGMPWAIAGATLLTGERDAWTARAVSAGSMTALVLLSAFFAGRWFGAPLAGGVGVLATCGYWAVARSADIEAALCLATALAVLPMVEVLARPGDPGRPSARFGWGTLAAAGLAAAMVLKGPAVLPAAGGALLGCALAAGWRAALLRWWTLGVLATAAAAVGALALALAGRLPDAEPAVTQSVGEFLWRPEQIPGILLFPLGALALGLPATLGVLFPWGPDARAEVDETDARVGSEAFARARALAAGCLAAMALAMLAGLANPRYGLPALVLAGPLLGYVAIGAEGRFDRLRARLARFALLGRPWTLAAALAAAGYVYGVHIRPEGRDGGRLWGHAVAHAVAQLRPDRPATVWAGSAAFARPEVLWYAERAADSAGIDLVGRWKPDILRTLAAQPQTDDDDAPPEFALLRASEVERLGQTPVVAQHLEAVAIEHPPRAREQFFLFRWR